MKEVKDYQIADLLIVSRKRLAYCKFIVDYPDKSKMKNYDNIDQIDSFYKNICNSCFCESVMLTATLIDKDSRVVSFWNWANFKDVKKAELTKIVEYFDQGGLKELRDQVMGHADKGNNSNNFPLSRTQGMIHSGLIINLDFIHRSLVNEFFDYTSKNRPNPYIPSYFDVDDATKEIERIMDIAKPKLTNNFIL